MPGMTRCEFRGGHQRQRRSFKRGQRIATWVVSQEIMPMLPDVTTKPPVSGEPQAEGQRCWFRQLTHQTSWQQPGVGIQACDSCLGRVQDESQRVLVVQQGDAAVA